MGIFKIKTFHATHGSNLGFYFIFQKSMSIFEGQTEVKCKLRSLFQITFDSYEGLEPLTEEGMMLLKTNKT